MDDSLLRPPQLVEFVRRDIIGVTLVQMLPVRFLTAVRGGRTRKVIFPSRADRLRAWQTSWQTGVP